LYAVLEALYASLDIIFKIWQQKKLSVLCAIQKKDVPLHAKFLKKSIIMNYLTAKKKQEIFKDYGKSNTDTGSPESQVALFSYRINHLTEHLKVNKKDHNTERSLLRLVGKRRRLLDYLKRVDIDRYRNIVKALNLRK
jgi:small subunit ribosomal protein S15